ncbi:hypothetical protein FPSE_01510, partial [Fusarium pseudograminearum CS3096]
FLFLFLSKLFGHYTLQQCLFNALGVITELKVIHSKFAEG